MIICLYGILTAAVITDLLGYKVPNLLILTGLVVSIFINGMNSGPPGAAESLINFIILCAVTFPLFFLKALGGGDCKLFGVIASFTSIKTALSVIPVSLAGGVIIGLIKILFEFIFRKDRLPTVSRAVSINQEKILCISEKILSPAVFFSVRPLIQKVCLLLGRYKRLHIIHFTISMLISTVIVMKM